MVVVNVECAEGVKDARAKQQTHVVRNATRIRVTPRALPRARRTAAPAPPRRPQSALTAAKR
jgi:hypothetical protein